MIYVVDVHFSHDRILRPLRTQVLKVDSSTLVVCIECKSCLHTYIEM